MLLQSKKNNKSSLKESCLFGIGTIIGHLGSS